MGQRGKGVPPVLHLCKIKMLLKGSSPPTEGIPSFKISRITKWYKERHIYSDSKWACKWSSLHLENEEIPFFSVIKISWRTKEIFGIKYQFQKIFTYYYECNSCFAFLLLILKSKLHNTIGIGSYNTDEFHESMNKMIELFLEIQISRWIPEICL